MTAGIQTDDDPTGGGYYCGAKRSQRAREHPDSGDHLYCANRAGHGTPTVGVGRCSNHGGATPSHKNAARLKLAELVDPAIVTLGRAMTDEDVKVGDRLRAADSVLDRTGYPRTTQIDVEAGRLSLAQRIAELRAESEESGELAEPAASDGDVAALGAGGVLRSTESADSTESVESTEVPLA